MEKLTITRTDVEQTLATRDLVLPDYAAQEWVVTETFKHFPNNTDYYEVLLKVTLLNKLYSTSIRDVKSVARNIVKKHIDADLAKGKPEVVHKIAQVLHGDSPINHFSFATKYCSFHQPERYPIYDKEVYAVLDGLRKEFTDQPFSKKDIQDKDWNEKKKDCGYNLYRKVYDSFMAHYGKAFRGMNYKDVDQYLWGSRKIASLKPDDERISASNRKHYKNIAGNDLNKLMNK